MIEKEHHGGIIDQISIKKVIDSFMSLEIDDAVPHKQSSDLYKKEIERPIVDAVRNYFIELEVSSEFNILDYSRRVGWCSKVYQYLDAVTCRMLFGMIEDFISLHAIAIQEEFPKMLDSGEYEGLQELYELYALYSPIGLGHWREHYEQLVEKAGQAAVENLVNSGDSAASEDLDPSSYVNALLEVHKKYFEIVKRGFRGDAGFMASLDKACLEFVNRNAATGSSTTKSSELLVRHADALLRKNTNVPEDLLENALNQLVGLNGNILSSWN